MSRCQQLVIGNLRAGYDADDGSLQFGDWVWRYDLAPAGPSETKVTLSYD